MEDLTDHFQALYDGLHDIGDARVLNAFIAVKARIASLEAQLKEREWISVDAEMPPEKSHGYSDWILVATNHDGDKFVCQDKRDFHGGFWTRSSTKVTHWMKLPEAPQ